MSNKKYPYNELVKWLEDYFKQNKDIKTYRGLEESKEFKIDVEKARKRGVKFSIDPMLPVDLIKVEEKTETDEETGKQKPFTYYQLFWVVVSDQPNLEKMMQFYQFYLSRVSEPYLVTTVMVLPFGCDNSLKDKLKKIAEENKFGLWHIDTSKETPEEIFEPKTLRERMVEEFKNPKDKKILKELPEEVRGKPESTAKFFDTYVRDAIEAMVGITPEQLGKRYIERKVLDLVFDLENVSYQENLRELVTQHLSQKTNDYEFVAKAFSELWDINKFGIKYSDFLETFEPALHHVFAEEKRGYRDHYLHQFQVFLLGVHIIDKFHNKFPPQIEKQWLVASSFHDMAYPVQLYDSWSKKFFESSLGITDVGASDLKSQFIDKTANEQKRKAREKQNTRSQFIDKTLLSCMGYLINSLCETHRGEPLHGNWLADEEKLVKFFYKEITEVKHHCIISSVSLLKKVVGVKAKLLKDVFIPAALAIAFHDKKVWDGLKQKHKLSMIEFDKDPLSFLLLFCDCVQEWGRPTVSDEEKKEEERFFLKKIEPSESRYSVTIWTPHLPSTNSFFMKKETEVKELEGFLRQSSIEFEIILEDKSGKEGRPYKMKGV